MQSSRVCHTNTILPAGSSSSGSSSDDEVKEAFENTASPHSLWPGHTHPWPRPIRVPPTGCRKKAPKYFAQMSSAGAIERPRLDFNKMQYSKRFVMVSVLSSLPATHDPPPPSLARRSTGLWFSDTTTLVYTPHRSATAQPYLAGGSCFPSLLSSPLLPSDLLWN